MYISLTEARGLGSHCAVGGRLRRQRSYGGAWWPLIAEAVFRSQEALLQG